MNFIYRVRKIKNHYLMNDVTDDPSRKIILHFKFLQIKPHLDRVLKIHLYSYLYNYKPF